MSLSLGRALPLALALAGPLPAWACPIAAPGSGPLPDSAQSASAGAPGVIFDWFANGAPGGPQADQAEILRAAERQLRDQGPLVCPGSGAGRSSPCLER
jgi:hypothetical protein